MLKAHGTCYKRVLQSPDQHSQGPFKMQLPIGTSVINHFTQCRTPNSLTCIRWKNAYDLLDKPTYRFPKDSSYAIRCWGYRGSTAHSTLNLHPAVSILQHITSYLRKPFTSDLRNASTIQAMAILPNYLPSTGWCRGYLATNRIGEFSMSAVLSILVLPRWICDDNTSELNSPGHCHNP